MLLRLTVGVVATVLVFTSIASSRADLGSTPRSSERTIGVVHGQGEAGWTVRLKIKGHRVGAPCLSATLDGIRGGLKVCGPVDRPYQLVIAARFGQGKSETTVVGIASGRAGQIAEARLGASGFRRIRLKPVGHFAIGGFVLGGGLSPCLRRLVVRAKSGALVGVPGQGFCDKE